MVIGGHRVCHCRTWRGTWRQIFILIYSNISRLDLEMFFCSLGILISSQILFELIRAYIILVTAQRPNTHANVVFTLDFHSSNKPFHL